MIKGYAVIQLPEYLLSLFNYLKKIVKTHLLYGNKASDLEISTQGNKTELSYAKTSTSTVIVQPKDAPLLHERVTSLQLTVNNIQSELEEISNLISLK